MKTKDSQSQLTAAVCRQCIPLILCIFAAVLLWTMAAYARSNDAIGSQKTSIAGSSPDQSAPSGHKMGLSGTEDMTITVYLPLVAKNYTHPLLNGDFETVGSDGFAAYWEHDGDVSVSTVTTLSNGETCTGTHCILLGNPDYPCNQVPLGYGRIYQVFGVPTTGTVKLSFDYRIFSYDEFSEERFDTLEVYIDDTSSDNTSPVRILVDGSTDGKYGCGEDNLDDTGWRSSEFDLSTIPDGNGGTVDFRGKTVQLSFDLYSRELPGYTIAWYNTWAYLDNVQVQRE